MKISTKGRYGTRFMLELALIYPERPMTIKEAAANQRVSEKYLEQIIPTLKKVGMIRSYRGAQGGYMLNQPPEEITIGMILRHLEGSLVPVDCVECNGHEVCDRVDRCVTKGVWEKIYHAVNDVVDHITLADLMKDYQKKQQQES